MGTPRYEKMVDTDYEWLGEIPSEWKLQKIQTCIEEINQKNSPVVTKNILSLTNTDGVIPYNERGNQGNKAKENFEDYKVVYENTIVANSMNILIGSVGLSKYMGCVSPVYYVYAARGDNDIRFFNYILNTRPFQSELRKYANGILEIRLRVSSNDILKRKVGIPEPQEQTVICDFLDAECKRIDDLMTVAKESIEDYKLWKQSIIHEVITKGLNKDDDRKDSGVEWIGEMPKQWEVIKVKYATDISRGLFNHRPRNDERMYGGAHPFIQTGDVARADKYITEYKQTLSDLGTQVSKKFPAGTLTMTIAANVGDVAILNFDAYFPDSVLGFVPRDFVSTEYLYYIFSAMKSEFIRTAIVSTQLNLNIERVKELYIPITRNNTEQVEIVDFLNSKCEKIDNMIREKLLLVDELEEYKKSLIYEVVTGKRKVV